MQKQKVSFAVVERNFRSPPTTIEEQQRTTCLCFKGRLSLIPSHHRVMVRCPSFAHQSTFFLLILIIFCVPYCFILCLASLNSRYVLALHQFVCPQRDLISCDNRLPHFHSDGSWLAKMGTGRR